MKWSIQKAEGTLAAATLVLGMIAGFELLERGAWLDEFFTLVSTLPNQSWTEFEGVMAHEAHPPLYFLLVECARKLGLSDLGELRALNLLGLPLVLAAVWSTLRRNALSRGQACVLLAIYASSPMFLDTFADLRAYFLVYSAGIAATCWTLALLRMEARGEPWDRRTVAFWGISLGVFANLHYFAVLMAGLLTLSLVLVRRGRGVLGLMAVSALAAAPAVILFVVQRTGTGPDVIGWIQTGRVDALLLMLDQISAAGAGNEVAFGLAVATLLIALERRAHWGHLREPLVLIVVLTAFFGVLTLANMVQPIVVDRYLIAGGGCVVVALALLAAGPQAPRWSIVAICTFALLSQARALYTHNFERVYSGTHVRGGWTESASAVKAIVDACPTTRVFIDPSIYARPHDMFTEARRYGLRFYAVRYGLHPQEVVADENIPTPGVCPNIVWFEHMTVPSLSVDELRAQARLEFHGRIEMERHGSGVLLVNSAAAP